MSPKYIQWSAVITRSSLLRYYIQHWLQFQWQKVNQILESQQTPHTSPSWASYGVSFVRIWGKNDRVITALYCSNHQYKLVAGLACGSPVHVGIRARFLSLILKPKSFRIFPPSHLIVFYLHSKWLGSQVTWRNPKWLRLLRRYLGPL